MGGVMLARLRRTLARLAILIVPVSFGACQGKPERQADLELVRGPVVRSAPSVIVVLGSSTSAGVGPRDAADAYVPRYAALLSRQFPDFRVVNLAVSGQTTYHVQPTGFEPPAQRPRPAPGHNISAALALAPAAILVNLPSNDSAANIPAAEQLENLARVTRLAAEARVLVWMTSTQPRHFSESQIAVQRQVRGEILSRYSPRALDFWTPFAAADGTLQAQYDAGDGIHLNGAGHSLLLKLVVGAQIPEAVLGSGSSLGARLPAEPLRSTR
jgi:lysophospholipase L1-like esterase